MSSMNPLKFLGGMILEIGAVVAVLAVLPGMGGSNQPNSQNASYAPNQVFFDAQSSRVWSLLLLRPRAAWQSEFAPPPPVAQQRFVEGVLDHNSQRAMEAAMRFLSRGEQLLPPELRVPRQDPAVQPSRNAELPTWQAQREQTNPSHYGQARDYPPREAPQRFNDRY